MTNKVRLIEQLLDTARKAGADAADAVFATGESVSVAFRDQAVEHVERADGSTLGLRVFVGRRSAIVSSSVADPSAFQALAERAVAMARVVPEDPFAGLADHTGGATPRDFDLLDTTPVDTEMLIARAREAEAAARSTPGITNTEGAEASWSRSESVFATSAGFIYQNARSSHSVSASAIAGSGISMQRDHDYHGTIHLVDLDQAAAIGTSAAQRALQRLNPTRPRTAQVPVVYDPRVAGSIIGHLTGAINGSSIAIGTSFLKDKLGSRIFPEGVELRDDPHRQRGPRSRLYDGEGVPTQPRALIDNGVLTTWLLDSRTARQLGLTTTGHATRGASSPPSPGPTNLYFAPGTATPNELMADISYGLYVTELIGMGGSSITGDYSRGAAGFLIRDGELAEPVAEITIAGNLLDMFQTLRLANNLVFRRGTDSPTLRIEGLTMAGG